MIVRVFFSGLSKGVWVRRWAVKISLVKNLGPRKKNLLRGLGDTYIPAHHKTHNARAAGPSQVYATTESVLFGSRRFSSRV